MATTAAKIAGSTVSTVSKICGTAKASINYVMGVQLAVVPSLIDSVSSSSWGGGAWVFELYSGNYVLAGQAINLPSNYTITKASFYLAKNGSPTGNMTAQLFASTGTVGTNAKGTGAALATSSAVASSSLGTSHSVVDFEFSSPYSASAGDIVVALAFSGGSSGNSVSFGLANSTTHPGNRCASISSWEVAGAYDSIFYLYGY